MTLKISKETQILLDQIHEEFEKHEAKIDTKIACDIKRQRKAAYRLIDTTITAVRERKKYVQTPTYKIAMCEKMRKYVDKYGWLPDSYKRMCRKWRAGLETYLNEWRTMLGWVEECKPSTSSTSKNVEDVPD